MNIHKIIKNRRMIFAALLAFISTPTLAHTDLISSVPPASAQLEMSPEKLVLNFSEPVQLMQVNLVAGNGDQVQLGFKPNNQSVNKHELPVPSLSAEQYTVTWVILGSDGHRMEDSFGFGVGTAATQPEPSAEDHSSHQN